MCISSDLNRNACTFLRTLNVFTELEFMHIDIASNNFLQYQLLDLETEFTQYIYYYEPNAQSKVNGYKELVCLGLMNK